MYPIREILSLLSPDQRTYGKLWSTYSLTWLPLAANAANVPDTVTTSSSSDFLALTMRAYVTTNANPPVEVAAPQATLTFQIASNLLQPDNTPIHIANLILNANKGVPYELDFPTMIRRNTQLTGFITDLSGAISNVRIEFGGIRLLPGVTTDLA